MSREENRKLYNSAAWKRLRCERLEHDGHRCTAPGCNRPALVVEHVQRPSAGGETTLENLTAYCNRHRAGGMTGKAKALMKRRRHAEQGERRSA